MNKSFNLVLSSLAIALVLQSNNASATQAAPTAKVDTQFLAADTVVENTHQHFFSLSPNGEHAAHIENRDGTSVIIIKSTTDTKRINAGAIAITELHWIDNEQLVFASNGQLRLLQRDGSGYRILLDNLHYREDGEYHRLALYNSHKKSWSVINPLHKQPNTILVGAKDEKQRAYVYELNIKDGFLKTLANGRSDDVNEWMIAANGRISFGVKQQGNKTEFLASADQHWQNFDSGNESIGLALDGGSYLKRRTIFLGLSNDADSIYLSENLHTDRFRVVQYNLAQHRIETVLAEDSRYDIGGDEHTQLAYDRFDGTLAGIHYHTNQPHTVWLDTHLAALQTALDAHYPHETHRIKQWDEERTNILVESYDHAARATMYTVNGKTMSRLKLANLHSQGNNDAPYQAVQFTSRDGYTLDGFLTLPKDNTAAAPLVVLPHGGPWSRDIWSYNEEAQFFAANGYATLTVNFRGSTGQGFQHIQAGVGEFSGLMLDDIADGARWAIDQGIADAQNIYILGTSYGGYAAIMGAVRYPTLFKALSANAAPLDIAKQFKHYRKNDLDFAYNFWSEAVIDPKSSADALKKMSPIHYLAELDTPYKLFHGADDSVVPVSHIRAAQKQVDDKHRIEVIEGEGHGFQSPEHRRKFLESSLDLFKNA